MDAKTDLKARLPSRHTTEGADRAPHRAFYYAMGLTEAWSVEAPGDGKANGDYPGYLTYCFMTIDQGDTVLGGFDTPAFASCLVKAAGVTYDGQAHTATIGARVGDSDRVTGERVGPTAVDRDRERRRLPLGECAQCGIGIDEVAAHALAARSGAFPSTLSSSPRLICPLPSPRRTTSAGREPRLYFLRSAATLADISRRYVSGA